MYMAPLYWHCKHIWRKFKAHVLPVDSLNYCKDDWVEILSHELEEEYDWHVIVKYKARIAEKPSLAPKLLPELVSEVSVMRRSFQDEKACIERKGERDECQDSAQQDSTLLEGPRKQYAETPSHAVPSANDRNKRTVLSFTILCEVESKSRKEGM